MKNRRYPSLKPVGNLDRTHKGTACFCVSYSKSHEICRALVRFLQISLGKFFIVYCGLSPALIDNNDSL